MARCEFLAPVFLAVSDSSATMAGLSEINSFMGKFVSLWQSGRNASLKVESKAGQAHVTLQLDLGHPLHHPQQ